MRRGFACSTRASEEVSPINDPPTKPLFSANDTSDLAELEAAGGLCRGRGATITFIRILMPFILVDATKFGECCAAGVQSETVLDKFHSESSTSIGIGVPCREEGDQASIEPGPGRTRSAKIEVSAVLHSEADAQNRTT